MTVQLLKKEIRNWTFYDCSNLQTVNMEGVGSITEDAFTDTPIHTQKTTKINEDLGFI